MRASALDKREIVRRERLRSVYYDDRQVGVGHGLIAALNTESLHQVLTCADPSGVDEPHGNPFHGGGLGNQVARCAGDIGHDGAVLFEEAVKKAALADVRASGYGEREAVVYQLAPGERSDQVFERGLDGRESMLDLDVGSHIDV